MLTAPTGYGLAALLAELAGEACASVAVLDAAALAAAAEAAKDSESGVAIKAFRAERPDAPLPGRLLAPLLAARLADLKTAGLAAREAPAAAAAAAAEAHAAAAAAAKEAGEEPPPAPAAAAAAGPADAYYVLANFGSEATDFASLAKVGLAVDSAVWLGLTSGALREAAGGSYEPPSPAEGEVVEDPEAEVSQAPLAAALAAAAGAADSGLEHCACVTLSLARPAPAAPEDAGAAPSAGWGAVADVAAKLSALLSAMAAKRTMYGDYVAACQICDVPLAPESSPAARVYASLADAVPLHAQGVPFLLDCLLSQVDYSLVHALFTPCVPPIHSRRPTR